MTNSFQLSDDPMFLWSPESNEEQVNEIMAWHAVYNSYFDSCRTVLDIGCGNGFFLEIMRAAGKEILGIDTNPKSVDVCLNRGLEVRQLNATEIASIPEVIDAIHACHILEYLTKEETDAFFAGCRSKLGDNGFLLVRTSNWTDPKVRDERFRLDSAHRQAYPLELLEEMLAKHGFDITAKGFENKSPNDLFVIASARKESARSDEPTDPSTASTTTRIAWEGSQLVNHSLARVNREMVLSLLENERLEISVIPYETHTYGAEQDRRFSQIESRCNATLAGPTQVHVRHQWPPSFNPPPQGRWVIIQPWEYGSIPKEWVEPMKSQVDEIWVPSHPVKDAYVQSGIPAEKVAVVPNGVHLDQFRPETPPYPLDDDSAVRFLFVGGTIWRKGIDVLVDAYIEAFTPEDSVCLVIKDMGQSTVYRNQGYAETIKAAAANPKNPKILYLEHSLSEDELAGLYTACQVLVHPFRGEGFALPVAEAAASGLPVIVTQDGPCNDYLTESEALWIKSKRRSCNVGLELAHEAWVLEPDAGDLIEKMRYAAANLSSLTKSVRENLDATRKRLSWTNSAAIAAERIEILARSDRATDVPASAAEAPAAANRFGAAPAQIPARSELETPSPRISGTATPLANTAPSQSKNLNDILRESKERAAELKRTLTEMKESSWARTGLQEDNPKIKATIADAHRLLAKRLYDEEDYTQAKNEITEALNIEPHHVPDLLVLGNIHFMDGDEGQAETCFKKATDLDPQNPSAFYNLGMIYRCREKAAEAASCFERAIQIGDQDPELYNNLGVLNFEMGDPNSAELRLKKALVLDASHVDSAMNLSTVYRSQGKISEAIQLIERVLRLNPAEPALLQEFEDLKSLKNNNGATSNSPSNPARS